MSIGFVLPSNNEPAVTGVADMQHSCCGWKHVCSLGVGMLPARCPDYQPVNGGPQSLALAEVRSAQEAHYATHFVLPNLIFWH